MRLTWTLVALLILVTACGIGGGTPSGSDDGAGGAGGSITVSVASSSVVSTSSAGPGGAGGTGGEGGVIASIATLDGCASPRIVGPQLPEEAGALALGRFTLETLPATLETFRFVGEPSRGQCADMATEVVYWASASAVPEETPTDAVAVPVPSTDGEVTVMLDPPLELTPERPYGFVGVRMAASGDSSACIVACPGSERPDDNWWSSAPVAPYGWDRLVDSAPNDDPATPGDGLAWDYVFTVSGS